MQKAWGQQGSGEVLWNANPFMQGDVTNLQLLPVPCNHRWAQVPALAQQTMAAHSWCGPGEAAHPQASRLLHTGPKSTLSHMPQEHRMWLHVALLLKHGRGVLHHCAPVGGIVHHGRHLQRLASLDDQSCMLAQWLVGQQAHANGHFPCLGCPIEVQLVGLSANSAYFTTQHLGFH